MPTPGGHAHSGRPCPCLPSTGHPSCFKTPPCFTHPARQHGTMTPQRPLSRSPLPALRGATGEGRLGGEQPPCAQGEAAGDGQPAARGGTGASRARPGRSLPARGGGEGAGRRRGPAPNPQRCPRPGRAARGSRLHWQRRAPSSSSLLFPPPGGLQPSSFLKGGGGESIFF